MCYSANVLADFAAFRRLLPRSTLALKEFYDLYWKKKTRLKPVRTPRAMDAMFLSPAGAAEGMITTLIEALNTDEIQATEQELFVLRRRLADAERALQIKPTKKALADQRIAGNKIAQALSKLESLNRTDLRDNDARIFPGWYAPVLMIDNGKPVIRPMRYGCRPAGKPALYDSKFPGTYNARRDNLRGFWRGQFGHTHAVMFVTQFYENVERHAAEHRALEPGENPENMVLLFQPQPPQTMYVACVYSHWTPPPGSDEPELWSFAAVTDEPLPEVADAGHDRTIVALRRQNVETWLTPAGQSLEQLDHLLEDKERPLYKHRKVA